MINISHLQKTCPLGNSLWALVIFTFAAACGQTSGGNNPAALTTTPSAPTAELPAYRATPVSLSPAVEICTSLEGDLVTVTINADVPDPRCVEIRPEKKLRVINRTPGPLQVVIGQFQAELEPEGEILFDLPMGAYLAPGVHLIQVTPCCSPKLWLK